MKHFIFTQTRQKKRGFTYTVTTLWIVKRNVPVKLGSRTSTFESEGQALMNCVEHLGALPARYLERHPSGAHAHVPWSLKEAGVATFHQL